MSEGQDGSTVLISAIQTSAAISPGNSGGAQVDLCGQVIGMPGAGGDRSASGRGRRRGCRLLRRRRAGLADARLLVAAAIATVVLATGAVGVSPHGAGARPSALMRATGPFNPLVAYVSFGWP